MFKRSLPLILLIATTATAGYAEDAWRGHSPTLIPQHSGNDAAADCGESGEP